MEMLHWPELHIFYIASFNITERELTYKRIFFATSKLILEERQLGF